MSTRTRAAIVSRTSSASAMTSPRSRPLPPLSSSAALVASLSALGSADGVGDAEDDGVGEGVGVVVGDSSAVPLTATANW